MINLMYLVFIAMLAMNMSKEVLSAFGLMNEKFESSNINTETNNISSLAALDKKASENAAFKVAADIGHKVEASSKKFYDFLGSMKKEVLTGVEINEKTGKLDYEAMDKADNLDNSWFTGDGYSKRGNDVISAFETYKSEMKSNLADPKYKNILAEVLAKFDTKEVKNKEGLADKFLNYHFKGFPSVASLAKISAWQADVKKTESDVISTALGKVAIDESSMKKFQAIVVLDKNAYFTGEKVTGKVVLGKYDPNAKFSGFNGPGRLENGQAVISLNAGGVGEQKIKGSFNFMEDGKPVPLPFEGTYVVVPRPNQATISADKMNVVYRGVPNPMSISFAGVSENNVNASAPGMSKTGPGKYTLNPGSGSTVMVTVSAKLPDGSSVSDKKEFRIKGIPQPQGRIRNEVDAKGPKSNLEVCSISAIMEGFDFPVTVQVTQFNVKVPGSATVVVQGNKMNGAALAAIKKASKGDVVTISRIQGRFIGAGNQVPTGISPCSFEVQ
jgi:gliding motility-associated protein GldM